MNSTSNQQAVSIILELVGPASLGLDPEKPAASELMSWCAMALGILSLDVSTVRLVVTGDLIESVKQRSTSEHQQQNYDTRRNSGIVAAKTMSLGDGRVDVLVPAWWFSIEVTDDQKDDCERLAKRTTVHEAQHVAMAQAGEADGDYAGEPWARHNFLNIADQVIGEYRAETAVGPALRGADDVWDEIDVLVTLKEHLRRIVDEYQVHLDVS